MPIERDQKLTRQALQVVAHHHFPVHIITKSTLVLRDIDLLQKINPIYAAVSITITTTDDELAKRIEPYAPSPSERFKAVRQLNEAGIYAGITFMPILPFITDTKENVIQMAEMAKQAKASYVLAAMGMTNREGQRDYFYRQLDNYFPGLRNKYHHTFGEQYHCESPHARQLWQIFSQRCRELKLPTQMKFYNSNPPTQLDLFESGG